MRPQYIPEEVLLSEVNIKQTNDEELKPPPQDGSQLWTTDGVSTEHSVKLQERQQTTVKENTAGSSYLRDSIPEDVENFETATIQLRKNSSVEIDDEISGHQPGKDDLNVFNRVCQRNLIIVYVHYFIINAAIFVAYIHFPAYFIKNGASRGEMTFLMTLLGLTNTFGRVLTGALVSGTGSGVLLVYIATSGLSGLSLILCPLLANFNAGRVMFVIGFSLYGSARSSLMAPLVLALSGGDDFSLAYGTQLFVAGVSALIGPPFAGWLYDISRDYLLPFFIAGALYLTAVLLMMILPVLSTPRKVTSD